MPYTFENTPKTLPKAKPSIDERAMPISSITSKDLLQRDVYNSIVANVQSLDFEEVFITAHMSKPIYSTWAVVTERPLPEDFVCLAPDHKTAPISILGDDCALYLDRDINPVAMVTISTIGDRENPRFLITLALHEMSMNALMCAVSFMQIQEAFSPISFPDVALLNALALKHKSVRDVRLAYAKHPDRTRPVAIHRTGNLTPKVQKLNYAVRNMLAVFGPIMADTTLHALESATPGYHSRHYVMTYPGHTSIAFDVRTRTTTIQAIEQLCFEYPPIPFNDALEFESASPLALEAFRYDFVKLETIEDIRQAGTFVRKQHNERNATYRARLNDFLAAEAAQASQADSADLLVEQAQAEPPAPDYVAPLDADEYPIEAADILDWAEKRFPELHILKRAKRALSKAGHPEPQRIAKALEALAVYRHKIIMGDRSLVETYEQALLDLRLRDTFTNAERLFGQNEGEYVVSVNGRRLLLDRHLASFTSGRGDPRLLRIYYTHDRSTDQIVIGWLPTHLRTKRT